MTRRTPMPKPRPTPPAPSAFLPAAPLPITRDTPFRATGDVTLETWTRQFRTAGAPFSDALLEQMWQAAKPVSALVLDRLRIESSYCTAHPLPNTNNCLGLRVPGSLDFAAFYSPVDGIKEVVRRWGDKTYRNGIYYPKDMSLAQMLSRYSPPTENPTEQLIQAAVATINTWRAAGPSSPPPVSTPPKPPSVPPSPPGTPGPKPSPPPSTPSPPPGRLVFGKVPRPNIIARIIPDNGTQNGSWVPTGMNSAWNNLGPRLFRGFCIHIMEGILDGTDEYFRNEARMGALTDFGLGSDQYEGQYGTIYQWNTKADGRSPWANGSNGEGGEEGDGPAFIARYGRDAINRDLRSIENSGFVSKHWVPDNQLIDCVNLMAYISDQEKVSWKDWPMKDGLTLVYIHAEFSPKECPGDYIISRVGSMIDQVGEILKKHQTGA
jgi:hypothetical protein